MALSAAKLVPLTSRRIPSAAEEPSGSGSGPSAALLEHLLPEPLFLRMLCLERKRAERSRKSFVLALVDLEGLTPSNGDGDGLAGKTVASVVSSIRETDSPGWFRENSVLGILFTELGAASRPSVLTALNEKLASALHHALTPEQRDRVGLAFHPFPEDRSGNKIGPGNVSPLYPDIAERDKARKISLVVKRAMDIAGSALGLILLSPIFLVIAIAIKLTSKGPVLFRQQRIGQFGNPFTFLKFRSMHCSNNPQIHMEYVKRFIAGDAEPGTSRVRESVVYKITRDPRVTRVGRFLRKTSLDELPQFFNVLKGDMSLVGPRPPLPYELEAYDVWHRRRLLEARPGITGLWQVSGRSRLRFDDMVRLDLCYARTWSLWLDVRILLQTPRAVLSGEGAY